MKFIFELMNGDEYVAEDVSAWTSEHGHVNIKDAISVFNWPIIQIVSLGTGNSRTITFRSSEIRTITQE